MTEINMSYLDSNDLSNALDKHMIDFFPDIMGDVHNGTPTLKRQLKLHETYLRNVLLMQGQVNKVCLQMIFATLSLSGFRNTSKTEFTRFDYITYHIENHFIRVSMVKDRVLQLVNTVFLLGIPDWKCRYSLIIQNDNLRRSPVLNKLQALQQATKEYVELRNKVVHRQTYKDEPLESLEIYYYMENRHPTVAQKARHLYKRKTDQYIRESKERLELKNKEVIDVVVALCDELAPVFEANYSKIQNISL